MDLNILSTFINFSVDKLNPNGLNWIGNLIKWLFDLFAGVPGGVGLGAIIFTICLKTIVLPLDAYSRVKSKKQSLLMEKMRPQMEKLQKQYANDKQMYSQKVMELQKANGYSPFGACLPMIVSIVIFMIVFSAFSTYSNYAMLESYNDMVNAYNASVQTYIHTTYKETEDAQTIEKDGVTYYIINEDGFLDETKQNDLTGFEIDSAKYEEVFEKYFNDFKEKNPNSNQEDGEGHSGYVTLESIQTLYTEGRTMYESGDEVKQMLGESKMNNAVQQFVRLNARAAAANYYRTTARSAHFAWIGNMWYPDSMLNKEVPDYSKFSSSVARASSGAGSGYQEHYDEVTYYLRNEDPFNPGVALEGNTYNGYFVLILLSIGTMFLQQFITSRAQKAANELSSVDGSAAKTNKWMMIIMPIMFGVFAFFYSAAFSLYMIVGALYGLLTTLIINKIVTVRFAKKEAQAAIHGGKHPNRKRLKNGRK